MKHTTLLACLLGAASLSVAQQEANLDSVMIRENRIVSSFSNQNRNIQVITRKEIAALAVKSTAELLSYVNGVDMRQRGPWGAQADVSIDGSTFDQVLVLINGVKMSDPQTGHHMMNIPVPISAIEQIEVLRGPAARIYGVNALAGAINIITRRPEQNEVSGRVYSGSSFKTDTSNSETYYNWGAQASASLAGKNQSHTFSINHDQGSGFRYNTAFNSYSVLYNNQIRLNDRHTIEALGGYISNEFGASLYYAAPFDNEAKETVQTAVGSIRHTWQANERMKISPRISYRYNKDDYIYIRQNPAFFRNKHETNVVTGEIQTSVKLNHGTLGFGGEWRQEQINSNNLGQRDRSNTGAYAEYKHYFSEKLNAGAGVYVNYNSDYGWQAYPGVDAGYRFLPDWKLFVNASTGQRLPTYTDLYYNGPSNIGNDRLQAEMASYSEGGVQYSRAGVFARASYFYRHATDFIDWVREAGATKWQPQNFQTINTQGFSVQTNWNLNPMLHLSRNYTVNVLATYNYLNVSRKLDINQRYGIEALRHQFIGSVRTLFFQHLQANITARYQYRINQNDYTLLDARLAWVQGKWSVFADANNLLDTQYRESGATPLPGRWFTGGVSLNFQ